MDDVKVHLDRKREVLGMARQELNHLLESRRDSPGFADISVIREAALVLISSFVFMDEWVEAIEKRVELLESQQISPQDRKYLVGQMELAEGALREPYPCVEIACGILVDAVNRLNKGVK